MAAGSIIGALRVILGADTAAFDKGLDDSRKKLGDFGASIETWGKRVGLAMTGVAAALGFAVKKTLDEADKLGKAAQSIGIPVEELSRLKHAADLSGVSFESLTTAVGRFSKGMAEAAGNLNSGIARTFDAIGVSATTASGQLRPTSAVLADVAEKFSKMEDGAGKTAIAIQLFGRAGAALIPMLNAGRDGLNELMQEADKLGIVIDGKTAQAAERFNDNLTRIHRVADGLVLRISASLLPALELLADKFLGVAKSNETVKQIADTVNVAFGFMAQQAASLAVGVSRLVAEFIAAKDALHALFVEFDPAKASAIWGAANAATTQAMASLKAFNNEIATATGEWRAYVEVAPKAALAQAPIIDTTNNAASAFRSMKQAAKEALDLILTSPTETFATKMNALETAVKSATITWGAFQKKVREVNEENKKQMLDLASASANALTTIFGKSKAAAIASAIVNTAVGITNALRTLPPPFSWAQAALIAATGAAQISSIKSQNFGGSGGGGGGSAPSVSGGGGGGEAPQSQAQSTTIALQGEVFTGDTIRNLIEKLNAAHTNGYRLVTA